NRFTGTGYRVDGFNPSWSEDWTDLQTEMPHSTNTPEYAQGVINPSYIENPRTILWGVSLTW
ncbi:hypothetical protein KKA85_00005, partial [bacterium]|nr:hypothetical protein [bacterium]